MKQNLKLLFLNGGFELDLRAMALANPGHEIKEIKHEVIHGQANQVIPESVRERLNWTIDDEAKIPPETLSQWIRFNDDLIAKIRSQYPFDMFVTPSDSFWWLRRFIRSLKQQGIPTVNLEKEGTCCDYLLSGEIGNWYSYATPFISDLLIVPSERKRQFWLGCGAEDKKIVITGQPRFDMYFHSDLRRPLEAFGVQKTPGRKMLLFLNWHKTSSCVVESDYKNPEWWETRMRADVARALVAFLRNHPDVDLVVKYHPRQEEDADHVEIQEILLSDPSLPIKIVRGREGAAELMYAADAVVGWFSTAVSESIGIGKPTIYTFWKELWPRFAERTLGHHTSGACEVATNLDEFKALLETAVYSPQTLPDRSAARAQHIAKHLGTFDGQNAKRCWDVIEQFAAKQNPQAALPSQSSGSEMDYVQTLEKMNQ